MFSAVSKKINKNLKKNENLTYDNSRETHFIHKLPDSETTIEIC